MKPRYPRRRRSLVYVGALIVLVCLSVTMSEVGNQYPQSSDINNALLGMAGLFIALLVIFILPFAVFAKKYWNLSGTAHHCRPLMPQCTAYQCGVSKV